MTITQEKLKQLLRYNPETGDFVWNKTVCYRAVEGNKAGCLTSSGYLAIRVSGKQYQSHRLAWLWVYGEWPRHNIDHKDGNKLNNSISNLRDVTQHENSQNRTKASKNNKSTGLLGVSLRSDGGAFIALIGINGKSKHLGSFKTKEEAHSAYIEAKRKHHSACTI